MDLGINYPEIAGHRFEMIRLERLGEMWYVQWAVDGRLYPAFFEPHNNVSHMPESEFLAYMKCQSLTMMAHVNSQVAQA